MLDKIAKEARDLLSRQVLFSTFVPALGFVIVISGLVVVYRYDFWTAWNGLAGAKTTDKLAIALAVLTGAIAISLGLAAAQANLISIWTGASHLWPNALRDLLAGRLRNVAVRQYASLERLRSDIECLDRAHADVMKVLTEDPPHVAGAAPAATFSEFQRLDLPRRIAVGRVSQQASTLASILSAIRTDQSAATQNFAAAITPIVESWMSRIQQRRDTLRAREARLEADYLMVFADRTLVVEPTRLGAILTSVGVAQRNRYGFSGALFLPHILQLAPEPAVSTLSSALASMELLINSASFLALVGIVGSYLALFAPGSDEAAVIVGVCVAALCLVLRAWPLFAAAAALLAFRWLHGTWALALDVRTHLSIGSVWWVIGAFAVASVLYRIAIESAKAASNVASTIVDLHRLKIFEASGFAPPRSAVEERAMWSALERLVRRGERPLPTTLKYGSATEDLRGQQIADLVVPSRNVAPGIQFSADMLERQNVIVIGDLDRFASREDQVVGRTPRRGLKKGESIPLAVLRDKPPAVRDVVLALSVFPGSIHDALVTADNVVSLVHVDGTKRIDGVLVIGAALGVSDGPAVAVISAPEPESLQLLTDPGPWFAVRYAS